MLNGAVIYLDRVVYDTGKDTYGSWTHKGLCFSWSVRTSFIVMFADIYCIITVIHHYVASYITVVGITPYTQYILLHSEAFYRIIYQQCVIFQLSCAAFLLISASYLGPRFQNYSEA